MAQKAGEGRYGITRKLYLLLKNLVNLIPSGTSADNPLATQSEINDIWSAQAVLGAKNFLSLSQLKALNTSGTWTSNVYTADGVTFTVEDDLSITVNADGNMSGSAVVFELVGYGKFLPTGDYLLSGCTGGSATTYKIDVIFQTGTYAPTCYDGDVALSIANDINYKVRIVVYKTAGALSNKVFKPMIRLASDTDDTYVPYAMTNRELTEKQSTKNYSVSTASGYNISTNMVCRSGNVVNVLLQVDTPSDLTVDNTIGTIPFLPAVSYAFLDIFKLGKPYEPLGKCFIRQTNGNVIIPQGINITGTSFYVYGTYICQD